MDALQEFIEDIEDWLAGLERRDESTVPHEEVIVQLRRAGIIPTPSDDQN